MKALNDLTFTLNILAATALLSVGFSFKSFFAFFIPMVMMVMVEMKFILENETCFTLEKRVDNPSENQITAIITATNEVSGGLCHRIFMRWVI
jgi:hypothetical protein